ncbi:MAG: trypsin-like peptidase domain-containing protein [Bacilli bacterium]|nr:trypsin-like peptidase domain-containing protein [Bacilli bacterium]
MEDKKEKKIKKEKKNEKKLENKSIYIVICLIILIVFAAFVVALNNVGLLDISSLDAGKSKEKVTLKYTDTNKEQKEGVYITDVSDVVEDVMPSIVAITSKTLVRSGSYGPSFFGEKQYSEGAGSGIIISQNENELLILTNNHVVEGAEELSVQFINGKSADARIKGTSDRKDVAVISVNMKNLDNATKDEIRIATMGDSSKLKVGNGIIAIGNALGYGQSVTTGVVSALNREVTIDDVTAKMIQIDAAINGGNSGGALLNSKGEVVGINSAKYSSSGSYNTASIEGMGFAIPITDVKDIVENLMNGENDTSDVTIGIEGTMVSESDLNMPTGFYISKVVDGSGADKAGLEIGNIITKIEGEEVTSISTIKDVLYDKRKGDKVTLTIAYTNRKQYSEKDVEVTLS